MSTTIETITVTRPMKVIAFTCTTITVFFMIASVSCSDWVNSEGWREGLFVQCIDPNAPTPIPFNDDPSPGCHRAHSAGYVRGTAALIIICVLTDFFGTLLTGLGLRSTDPNKKYKYYRVAIYSLLVATIALFLALIIYPVSFSKEIDGATYDGGKVRGPQNYGSHDFDGDGILDHLDDDDDNDGKKDEEDDDDDNDGIPDHLDDDDDNDGIKDDQDGDDDDFDNDGIPDHLDDDNDNDGTPDEMDTDDDNDGIPDHLDNDDDNDGIPDNLDDTTTDSDGDGTPDLLDTDDDNDGTPDTLDNDDDGDGVTENDADNDGTPDHLDNDDDNDGIPDDKEALDSDGDGTPDALDNDDDNDGIADHLDNDDDNDGIPDDQDLTGDPRVWQFGFGYGAGWFSVILMFASLTLLICDRESEEIFYKERPVEEDEEAGGEE